MTAPVAKIKLFKALFEFIIYDMDPCQKISGVILKFFVLNVAFVHVTVMDPIQM